MRYEYNTPGPIYLHVGCDHASLKSWESIDLDKWERTVKALQERKT